MIDQRERRAFHRNAMVPATLDFLRTLPEPERLGPRHRPLPHYVAVETIEEAVKSHPSFKDMITANGGLESTWQLTEDFAKLNGKISFIDPAKAMAQREWLKSHKGEYEYTGIDAAAVQKVLPPELRGDHGMVISVVHANDRSMSLRLGAALEVFICSNLATGTNEIMSIRRKHTGDSEPWDERISFMLESALTGFEQFGQQIVAMQNASLSDMEAKELIYDVFTSGQTDKRVELGMGMPYSKMAQVGQTYFGHDSPDVAEATRWALHNAFTRQLRELPLRRQQEAGRKVTEVLVRDLVKVDSVGSAWPFAPFPVN